MLMDEVTMRRETVKMTRTSPFNHHSITCMLMDEVTTRREMVKMMRAELDNESVNHHSITCMLIEEVTTRRETVKMTRDPSFLLGPKIFLVKSSSMGEARIRRPMRITWNCNMINQLCLCVYACVCMCVCVYACVCMCVCVVFF